MAEERYNRFQKLIDTGKEKGYLLYDDVSEVLPEELGTGAELDDLLAGLDEAGVDLLEVPKLGAEKKGEDAEELVDAEVASEAAEKTNDPVRMYLREMGSVALLTREGEIELARRIEHGQNLAMRSLSRSPLIMRELMEIAREVDDGSLLLRDALSIPELLASDDETDDFKADFFAAIEGIEKQAKKLQQTRMKLLATPRVNKPKQYRAARWALARLMVSISREIRKIQFSSHIWRRLANRLRSAVDELTPAEYEIARLQRASEDTSSQSPAHLSAAKDVQARSKDRQSEAPGPGNLVRRHLNRIAPHALRRRPR